MKPPVFNTSWSEEVVRIYDHDIQEMWDRTIAPHIFNKYHNQLNMYQSLMPNKSSKVLDVGCAQATLGLLLAEGGHHVTVVDMRQDFLDYAKSRWTHGEIKFIQGNIFDLKLNETFDIIFANQIIEHLVYPKEFVACLSSLLKDGGSLIATTPNGAYLKNNHLPSYLELGEPKNWEHMQFTADGDGHFFAYLKEELIDIFQMAGLKKIQCSFYDSPLMTGHYKFSYLHRLFPIALLKNLDRLALTIPFKDRISHQLIVRGQK